VGFVPKQLQLTAWDFCLLSQIVRRPCRAKVGVMKCDTLLLWISQVKGAAWNYVVNVPKRPVFPRHAVNKLSRDVRHKVSERAASNIHQPGTFTSRLARKSTVDSAAKSVGNKKTRIGCPLVSHVRSQFASLRAPSRLIVFSAS
jgi:hypothetical protein